MSQRSGDPVEELSHADPARMTTPPSESRARVWARIQEATMDDMDQRRGRMPRLVLGFGGLAMAAAAAVVAFTLWSGEAPPGGGPGTGIGSCVETYSLATLANREFAFDGTVAAVEGDEVSFSVTRVFAGDIGASVTLTATGMTGSSITSAGGDLTLVVGQRYLVAGEDEFAWACGFTQPYDAAIAADWAEAAR